MSNDLYQRVHDRFLTVREISNVYVNLDPSVRPEMVSKIKRLTYLNSVPKEIRDEIKCPVCGIGELHNSAKDSLWVCEYNPLKKLITDFVARYIRSPFSGDFELHDGLLKMAVIGLSGQASGILASRGFGKSVALALIAIIWCFFSAKGEDAFVVAPTSSQTEKVYSYMCDLIAASNGNMLKEGDPSIGYEGIDFIKHGQKPMIQWRQGSKFRPVCASRQNKGESMRGQQPTFEIIDESSYVIDEVYHRTLKAGMVSNRGDHPPVVIESGTPDVKNHFFDLFKDREKFKHYNIITLDYSDGIRCNRYDQGKIQEIMQESGGYDSEEFKSEYRCIFPESVTSFFHNLPHVFSNDTVEERAMPNMTYVAGLDLGRMNDSTILTIARHSLLDDGDMLDVVHVAEINEDKDMEYPVQYENIIRELNEWGVQECYVDFTGPGIPIYESLVAEAGKAGLNTTFSKFEFTSTSKYPAFNRLRKFFQHKPAPRVRYPNLRNESVKYHRDYNRFVKAEQEFADMIQRRTSSDNEKTKYKIMPSKSRGHDDYVASCICLSQVLSDVYSNSVGVSSVDRRNASTPRDTSKPGIGSATKALDSQKRFGGWGSKNAWRSF